MDELKNSIENFNSREGRRSDVQRLVMRFLFFLFKRMFYRNDGGPKRCTKCGCRVFECLVRESINGIPAEESYICNDCGSFVGYWAYGYFDPQYRRHGAA